MQLPGLLAGQGGRCIDRAQIEASLGESEGRFRALVIPMSDVVYRMSADWTEMHYLRGNYDGTRGRGPYQYRPTGTILPSAANIAARAKPLKNGVFMDLLSCEPLRN